MSLVNIAKNAEVKFGFMKNEDGHDFSCERHLEDCRWMELDLGEIYALKSIAVSSECDTLGLAISADGLDYETLLTGQFSEKTIDLENLKRARYVRLFFEGDGDSNRPEIEVCIDEAMNSGLIFDSKSIPDNVKFHAFYIGSCRYMRLFPKHFPARLHTTKEILNFLENYNKIDLEMEDVDYIYGDLTHKLVREKSIAYWRNMDRIFDGVTTAFVEISSRKYVLNNGVAYNNFYYNPENDKPVSVIDDAELFSDILKIKYMLRNRFGINKLVVIPHVSLLLDDGRMIFSRNDLRNSLKRICRVLNIEFLDINDAFPEESYFKDYMRDSTHYSKEGDEVVFAYINEYMSRFVE